ncbi:major facilitator superfamily transporter [Rhexocercosporidium sp. MPI-PUGE-AT-0058]|nr:major facilitator superfamily transporter [Rhexocercosporidium sp. MPI-PUGE-AT-0058]
MASFNEKRPLDSNELSQPTQKDSKETDNRKDPEKGISTVVNSSDENEQVNWDGDDDPNSPYNWSNSRKYTMTALMSLGGLVSTSSTSMMAPALNQISRDLGIGDSETQLTMSIYLLAFVFGPMIIGPLSELYGRKKLWIFCHCWYIAWNALAPVGKMSGMMVAGRLLSGFGGSVSISISGPTMADMFKADQRGKSYALVTFAPYLGAAIGPLVGGGLSQAAGWPWLFWAASIFDTMLITIFAILTHEPYGPVLLARKSKQLRRETGRDYRTKFERSHPKLSQKLKASMMRPVKLFFTSPIILILGLLTSYSFAIYVIALTTFSTMWQDNYGLSKTTSSLHYIAIALGSTIGSQVTGPCIDVVWAHLKAKNNGATSPEYRVPMMVPGILIMPFGIFLYGWAIEHHLHWIVVDIGAVLMSGGMMSSSSAMFSYLIDEFAQHSASSNAACRILSNSFAFTFPIFAPSLYGKLGYGWGNSMLALVYIGLAFPAPWVLWRWGKRIRAIGRLE